MTGPFPSEPMYSGFSAPSRFEADVFDLELVQGEVPKALNGTFFRVQPDPVWPPKMGRDIPLYGDGQVTAFRFENGVVDFKCRYVRTDKFEAERKARKALYGVYRNPYTDDPSVKGLSRGTANTTMIWHGGKLLALKEDSHPVEMDPITLETKGSWDFHGALTGETFTAHPKIDPLTGQLIAYGYEAKGLGTLDIAVYTVDRSGELAREEWMEAPYGCMIHDFGVTRDHILMPITPLWTNIEQIKAGGPHYSWDSQKESQLGVFSRDAGPSDLRWFTGPTCHSTHTLNAFDDGRKVHYDTPTRATRRCFRSFRPCTATSGIRPAGRPAPDPLDRRPRRQRRPRPARAADPRGRRLPADRRALCGLEEPQGLDRRPRRGRIDEKHARPRQLR